MKEYYATGKLTCRQEEQCQEKRNLSKEKNFHINVTLITLSSYQNRSDQIKKTTLHSVQDTSE